ncbi:hypothetical protein I6A84_19355 [Frankia sp. CNm7]|uniref:Uncharacterized protein n=1 Tax=Frankia nepalensis TaxID=1836974 RepID=A0A937UT89_9ACTN|nr:hypothetical protein [Frankia nepalensis]MBL7498416.1 hypothetical protein [Frankia nepalensis]MBL7509970.1 hypothetical protein [Frankia nepalensis]MBL7520188.1 hypothetical protein [Frankia nepalensis]MBL7629746.1 hypothetical protein [Frankia nepalensis]
MTGQECETEPDEVEVVGIDTEGGKQETRGGNDSKHDQALPVDHPKKPYSATWGRAIDRPVAGVPLVGVHWIRAAADPRAPGDLRDSERWSTT